MSSSARQRVLRGRHWGRPRESQPGCAPSTAMAAIELAKRPKRTTLYRPHSQAKSADDWACSCDECQSLLSPAVILRRAAFHQEKASDGAFEAHSPPRYQHVPLQEQMEKPNRSRVPQKYASKRAHVRDWSKSRPSTVQWRCPLCPRKSSHTVDVPGSRLGSKRRHPNAY